MVKNHTHNQDGHGCDHDHGAQTPATIATAVILFSLATVEWFAGKGLNNPGVIADAGHNFSDAVFALAVVLMIPVIGIGRKVFSSSHFMKCNVDSLVAIIIAFTTIVMIGFLSIEQVMKGVSTEHSGLVLLIGLVSWGINLSLGKLLVRSSHSVTKSLGVHLLSDATASLWISGAAIATLVVTWWGWNVIAAVIILRLAAKHNWHLISEEGQKIHRVEVCSANVNSPSHCH